MMTKCGGLKSKTKLIFIKLEKSCFGDTKQNRSGGLICLFLKRWLVFAEEKDEGKVEVI